MLSQDLGQMWKGTQFMTEKAGGSDVGALETTARNENGEWRLYGDKWFCSHADADVALLLARPEGAPAGTRGLALFALPRRLENGARNSYRIVRLKDKLGTKSMASGEIALEGALAYLVGDRAQRLQADDGSGEPVAPFARRARGRDDAPMPQRIAVQVARTRERIRQEAHRDAAGEEAAHEDHAAGRAGALDVRLHRRT